MKSYKFSVSVCVCACVCGLENDQRPQKLNTPPTERTSDNDERKQEVKPNQFSHESPHLASLTASQKLLAD